MSLKTKPFIDIALLIFRLLILCAYISLIFIKPTGEGWGRGWNLVAYWMYLAPAVFILGGLHVWRQRAIGKEFNRFDAVFTFLAFVFPFIAFVALKLKA
ncbi:hypothetical protein [Cellvibrio sp.]|uniref:hypothetical protein n=1 Tax=Cellvibrio sp. TaxID=1965322 RepID=UPI0039647A24